jgi:RNA polymerase sigma-70 factor, ECF subfamily
MVKKTNESLLIAYVGGDGEAFDTLFERLNVSIASYIKKSSKSRDVSKDLTQTLWERLIINSGSIASKIKDPNTHFELKPYLFKIARNLVNDHYRLSATKYSFVTNSHAPDGEDLVASLPNVEQTSPESEVNLQELSICIERRLALVSEEFRSTFELTRDNILSYAEAAETLNLSVETIKSRVKTVLKKIRPCLEMHHD